jgi:hypothetical protein
MKSCIFKVKCLNICKLTRRTVLLFKAVSDQVIGVRSKLIPRGRCLTVLVCPNFLTRTHPLENYQKSEDVQTSFANLNSCLDSSGKHVATTVPAAIYSCKLPCSNSPIRVWISQQLWFLPSNSCSLRSRVSRRPHRQYTVPSALARPRQSRLPLHSTFGISVETYSTGKHSVYTAALPSINQAN